MSRGLGQEISRIAVLFSSLYCIQEYGVAVSMTVGPSMMPTFNAHGDIVIVNRSKQLFPNYKSGDVIIASNPNDPKTIVCKRIIAMPKEKVYAQSGGLWSKPITVPEGYVWIQGDNRDNSTDSRRYGPVPIAMLKGKVVCKIYPFSQAGFIDSTLPDWAREHGNS